MELSNKFDKILKENLILEFLYEQNNCIYLKDNDNNEYKYIQNDDNKYELYIKNKESNDYIIYKNNLIN